MSTGTAVGFVAAPFQFSSARAFTAAQPGAARAAASSESSSFDGASL